MIAVLPYVTHPKTAVLGRAGGGNGSGENETGASYASFSINLPTTSGTRAADDPNFDHGSDYEYKVNDATLLIFKKGATEAEGDYTFVESAELGSMAPWKDPNETGVTTHAKITAKLEKVNKTDKFFALVLLNNGTGANAKVTLSSLNVGDTFSTLNAATNATDKFANYENGFYMANAPLFKDHNVTTLVPIESSKIYSTEEEAAKNAATDVYVERGLAKVTLGTGTTTEKTVADGTYKDGKVTISNWALDITNKKTFPIHNVDGLTAAFDDIWGNNTTASPTNNATNQRFVDNNTATLVKRVYWGIDPNYKNTDLCKEDADGTAARDKEFTYVKNNTDVKEDPSNPLYCLENTFNLDNMMQGQTTRIVFKATYTPKGFTTGDTFYKIGKNTAIWSKTDLETEIKAAVASVISGAAGNTTVTLNAEGYDITAAGTHYIAAANISVTGVETETITNNINAINTQLGLNKDKKVGISTYAGGESYYVARIKHFGDELTPWSSGNYGSDNLSFLGRYGMLRNNWYELTVDKVSGPGYPSVPEVKPNTPDDEDDKYISVSVKILDWAKRSQKVDL